MGEIIMVWKYNPFIDNFDYFEGDLSHVLEYFDDGTNIRIVKQGEILFKYTKSNGQILFPGDFSTNGF